MTSDEKRAYSRGYNAGRAGRWPDHRPPHPPTELVAELMARARELRDAVDGELAMLSADDEWQHTLGEPMDALDEAFSRINKWLVNDPNHGGDQ